LKNNLQLRHAEVFKKNVELVKELNIWILKSIHIGPISATAFVLRQFKALEVDNVPRLIHKAVVISA
jgi:hypothetical protein